MPRSFLHPGKRIKLHPDDWYAYGAHRGGIDERWFASTTEAANESRAPRRRPELLSTFEGKRFTLRDAVAEAGARLIGKAMFEQVQPLAGLLEVLRQHGPDPAPHAPGLRSTPALTGQEGKPESYYFPPQLQQRRQQLRLHVHGPGAGHDQGPGPQVPGELEQGRQRHPRSVAGLSPEARHRLADSARRAARARLALHLRAAVGLATCSACSSRWSKAARCPGRCWSRTCRKDKHQDLDFIIEPARLGEERRHALQGAQLPGADRRQGAQRHGLHRPLDRLRHGRRRAAVQRQGTDARAGREVHAARTPAPAAGSPCKAAAASASSPCKRRP